MRVAQVPRYFLAGKKGLCPRHDPDGLPPVLRHDDERLAPADEFCHTRWPRLAHQDERGDAASESSDRCKPHSNRSMMPFGKRSQDPRQSRGAAGRHCDAEQRQVPTEVSDEPGD